MRRRVAIGIALAIMLLVSAALAVMVVTYYVSITPTVVKSPVEFEPGTDEVSIIDNVNKTRASIQAKIIPLVKWVSEDALRIHNVNNTVVQIRLKCLPGWVSDPNKIIKSVKVYLIVVLGISEYEYLAIELGENGMVIIGESALYPMDINATYKIKVITEGKDGITAGTQATITVGLEVRPP